MKRTTSKPARKPKDRLARLMTVGGARVLALTQDKETVFYSLTDLDHGFGEAAFRLTKAIGAPGEEAEYDVMIDGARSTCECKGFLAHRHCKHLEGIEALIKSGKLPVCRKQPVIANAEEAGMANALLGRERHQQEKPADRCTLCGGSPVVEDGLCRDCLYPF
jgi:hypothetical protein